MLGLWLGCIALADGSLVSGSFVLFSGLSAGLAFPVGNVPAPCPSVIRHAGLSVPPLTMDHPSQCIPGHSCRKQRKQRVFCLAVGHSLPTLANIPLGLWVAFACLADIAPALVIGVLGCPGSTAADIKQRFPHLIQQVLLREGPS